MEGISRPEGMSDEDWASILAVLSEPSAPIAVGGAVLDPEGSGRRHRGVRCDYCGASDFPGIRHKCAVCEDYDLCHRCHEAGKENKMHLKEHPMLDVDPPAEEAVDVEGMAAALQAEEGARSLHLSKHVSLAQEIHQRVQEDVTAVEEEEEEWHILASAPQYTFVLPDFDALLNIERERLIEEHEAKAAAGEEGDDVVVSNLEFFLQFISDFIRKDLLQVTHIAALQCPLSPVINWHPAASKAYPLSTQGDGNCLLHACSLGMVGVHDRALTLRHALQKTLCGTAAPRFKERFRLQYPHVGEAQLTNMFKELQFQAGDHRAVGHHGGVGHFQYLEQLHIFVMAHVLRRPIIVYADLCERDPLTDQPVFTRSREERMDGVYLPLLWPQEACRKDPLVLTFAGAHFAPLVPTAAVTRSLVLRAASAEAAREEGGGGGSGEEGAAAGEGPDAARDGGDLLPTLSGDVGKLSSSVQVLVDSICSGSSSAAIDEYEKTLDEEEKHANVVAEGEEKKKDGDVAEGEEKRADDVAEGEEKKKDGDDDEEGKEEFFQWSSDVNVSLFPLVESKAAGGLLLPVKFMTLEDVRGLPGDGEFDVLKHWLDVIEVDGTPMCRQCVEMSMPFDFMRKLLTRYLEAAHCNAKLDFAAHHAQHIIQLQQKEAANQAVPCKGGCGFAGTADKDGYCSVCFRALSGGAADAAPAAAGASAPPGRTLCIAGCGFMCGEFDCDGLCAVCRKKFC